MPKRKRTKIKNKPNKKIKIETTIQMPKLPNKMIQLIIKNAADNDLKNLAVINKTYNGLV